MSTDLSTVKKHARLELGKIAGVEGFGVGDGTLRIYVRSARDGEQLPRQFEGTPVELVVVGDVVAAERPLAPRSS